MQWISLAGLSYPAGATDARDHRRGRYVDANASHPSWPGRTGSTRATA
jgi:hypothetical protein